MPSRRADVAVADFVGPFNCSQAVLGAYAGDLGLELATARRLATAFGAGYGHRGETCGVVSGALLVIGLDRGQGTAEQADEKARAYALAQEFVDSFRERAGSATCRTLLGLDLTDPAQKARAQEQDLFTTRCGPLVRLGVEILEEIL